MSLETGMYMAFGPDGTVFDRHLIEDMSLLPKQVYFRDQNMMPRPIMIEKTNDGYIVKSVGAALSLRNNEYLVTFLLGEEQPIKFQIKKSGDGYTFSTDGRYIVKSDEQGMGGAYMAKLGDQSHAAIIKLNEGN